MEQKTKAQKQWILGPNLQILIPRKSGVPFEEGLVRAITENKVIASNKKISQALMGRKGWKSICDVFPCWTGTMTAYVKPGQTLGKIIEYVDSETGYRWIFPVPEEYQDKKDAILVAEHPDYDLEIEGKTRIVRAAQVDLIERFPAENGWYLGDVKHDIPYGNPVKDLNVARQLYRIDTLVGPVGTSDVTQSVALYQSSHAALGVAVEAP